MNFRFNSFDLIVPPKVGLCKVNLEMIGFLLVKNLVIKPTFCDLTEVTFDVYDDSPLYRGVTKYMVLDIEDFGLYEITSVQEENDGVAKFKSVTANSYEISLNSVTLTYKDDTVYKLWDALAPEKSILGIISRATGWTIKHVDGSLINKYRTMDIDNSPVYALLMDDISTAFKCYFVFDNTNRDIYCYDRESDPINSGINLSFKNLVNNITISTDSEDIVTALTVTGAEGVGINTVNPLGNNVIYDFSYFMTDELWGMPKDLQEAIKAWQEKIDSKQSEYTTLVLRRKTLSEERVRLDSELAILKADLTALLDVQSVAIAGNNNERLAELYPQIENKRNEISRKQNQIALKEIEYATCVSNISQIVISLSLSENFTEEQRKDLACYTKGSVYENENFVFTSVMTEADRMDVSQQLYEQGLKVFKKFAHPLYEFDVDVSPFLFSKEYEPFYKAIALGHSVNLEVEPGNWVSPRLVQVVIDYDNPDNTSVILSDTYRLINDVYKFSDDFNNSVKTSRKTSLSAPLWDEPNKTGFYTSVSEYINNALNLANQEIINATNQEFTLGSYGLRGKMYDEDNDVYDPHQVAMTNNVLAFTQDNWNSCSLALGRITIGETEYYGLVAEAIVGNLIAGEQLTIANENNSFVVDGSGATLKNADFTIENDVTRIILSPEDGFKIQRKKSDGTWEDVLSEDTSGGIIANNIKLESSNIGGWTTNKDGFSSPVGDYINSDGTGKLSLLSWNPTSATFAGNIYANNLNYRYGDGTVAYVFNNGTMGGGWLTDGSVTPAKLDRVYASEVYCDNLVAENIEAVNGRIDNLSSEFITTEVLEAGVIGTTDLIYGGKLYSGTPTNHTTLYTEMQYISTEAPNVASYVIEVTGNIDVRSNVGSLKTNCPIIADNLTVSKPATFNQGFNITAGDVSGNFSFTGQITTTKESFIRDKMFICDTDLVVVHGEGAYYGVTQDVTIGDKTLYIKNGIIVGVS